MMGNVSYICHTKWSLLRTIKPDSTLFANSKEVPEVDNIYRVFSVATRHT